MDEPTEFVEPSTRARWLVLLFIIVMVLATNWIVAHVESLQPPQPASDAEIEQAYQDLQRVVSLMMFFGALTSGLFTLYFLRLAANIRRSRRYPPLGMAVLKRTRIRRGDMARRYHGLALLLAVISWVPLLGVIGLKWMLGILAA